MIRVARIFSRAITAQSPTGLAAPSRRWRQSAVSAPAAGVPSRRMRHGLGLDGRDHGERGRRLSRSNVSAGLLAGQIPRVVHRDHSAESTACGWTGRLQVGHGPIETEAQPGRSPELAQAVPLVLAAPSGRHTGDRAALENPGGRLCACCVTTARVQSPSIGCPILGHSTEHDRVDPGVRQNHSRQKCMGQSTQRTSQRRSGRASALRPTASARLNLVSYNNALPLPLVLSLGSVVACGRRRAAVCHQQAPQAPAPDVSIFRPDSELATLRAEPTRCRGSRPLRIRRRYASACAGTLDRPRSAGRHRPC